MTGRTAPFPATGPAPRLGLALSGGGDSTALLLALRAAAPDLLLYAYIVDHALRPESAGEARRTAAFAARQGAQVRLLHWDAPRPGQGHARTARHRLLAQACRNDGVFTLCLAHTLDDRIETLRMRASRGGPQASLVGPGPLDPSPVWPEGRGLVIARPFLDLTRDTLRGFLHRSGADWIEDPSNADPAYERVRLRQTPISARAAHSLLDRSDAARRAQAAEDAAALALIERGARFTVWGGALLDPDAFARDRDASEAIGTARAFQTLVMAVSGRQAAPAPDLVRAGLDALRRGRTWTGGGALLTPDGVLGRDPGAAGRADARSDGPKAASLRLEAFETGVFDGRFEITGPARIEMLGERRPARFESGFDPHDAPGLFRATLPHDAASGAVLADGSHLTGGETHLLCDARIAARLVALKASAWFDGVFAEARACAALAKRPARSNMRS
ncbi:tRNA lysidine(34) synthetase TilS [Maricaulaceae bacterium MS644]